MAGLNLGGRDKALWAVLLALCVVNAVMYACAVYPALPQTVPTHWGASGSVDGWGDKSTSLFLAVMPLMILGVMYLLPRIDPKGRNFESFKGVYQGFAAGLVLFFTVLSWMVPLTVLGVLPEDGPAVTYLVCAALGILLAVLGACMPRIEPNYTFGVRLPWTVASERNWRRTHRFAGPVFVVMGVCTAALGLVAPIAPEVFAFGLLALLFGGTAFIALYSYVVWRRG